MKTPSRTLCVLMIFMVILPFFFSGCHFFGKEEKDFKLPGHHGLGLASYNIPNRWFNKFRYLNGGVSGYIKARKDNAQLIHSSELESGTIVFNIYNKNNHLLTFHANNTTDTIKGVFVKGERYRITASATKARNGRFNFKME